MRNAAYRKTKFELQQERKQKLKEAEALLEQARAISEQRSQSLDADFKRFYGAYGGNELDTEIKTAESLMLAGQFSRAYDTENLRYNLRLLQQNKPPEEFPKAPVSAAVQLGAVREHRRCTERRLAVIEEARLATAEALEAEEQRQRAESDKENRKDTAPGEPPAMKAAGAATPEAKTAPPIDAATSRVA